MRFSIGASLGPIRVSQGLGVPRVGRSSRPKTNSSDVDIRPAMAVGFGLMFTVLAAGSGHWVMAVVFGILTTVIFISESAPPKPRQATAGGEPAPATPPLNPVTAVFESG